MYIVGNIHIYTRIYVVVDVPIERYSDLLIGFGLEFLLRSKSLVLLGCRFLVFFVLLRLQLLGFNSTLNHRNRLNRIIIVLGFNLFVGIVSRARSRIRPRLRSPASVFRRVTTFVSIVAV
jgi:hypothetical protein